MNTQQSDLSKDEKFTGTILCGQIGKDYESPDATFASEDGQQSLAHKMVLTSTRRSLHISRLGILVFEVSNFYNITPIFLIVTVENVISDVDDFNAFGDVDDGSSNSKNCMSKNFKKYSPEILSRFFLK